MKQKTQRQVSVRGDTYGHLKAEAKARGKSISQLVEELVAPVLNQPEAQAVDSAPREG